MTKRIFAMRIFKVCANPTLLRTRPTSRSAGPVVQQGQGESVAATRPASSTTFDPVFCDQADAAVVAVEQALAQNQPFAVVFMDMLMPPGKDGVWAAARIRELDPAVEIVICTAYSDVDPSEIGGIVPPEEKLSYLQKPFHSHEVRQTTIALAANGARSDESYGSHTLTP